MNENGYMQPESERQELYLITLEAES